MELKSLLNPEQYEAATTVEGPLLILAGAGSGKTRVLTYRIANMIENAGIHPSSILAITFTNKAAGEMRERVKKLVGDVAGSMWISTFHSSCVRILRREIDKLGYNKNFTIYDSDDAKAVVKQCMKELNINEKDITDREISSKISACKNKLMTPEQFKKESQENYRQDKIAEAYILYTKKLKTNNALDFDDLIMKTVELLRKHPDVLEFYQRKFKYIMVDEYQDTNEAQYKLVKILASAHKNICVVGDDDQCIYEWRGADINNILDFEKDFPETKTIKLEQNYRSKGIILEAANDVIRNNVKRKNKALRTEKDRGEQIKIYKAVTAEAEADFIATKIKEHIDEGKGYDDFAILYRMNSQSRILEDAMRRNAIPYRIIGGVKFYNRKEIKDILAYLRFINNPQDDVSLQRIINTPKRGIGDTTVENIREYAGERGECLYSALLDVSFIPTLKPRAVTMVNKFAIMISELMAEKDDMTISELTSKLIEETEYLKQLEKSNNPEDESRVENIKELISEMVQFEERSEDKSLEAYLEQVTLVSDVDNLDEEAEGVVMMTVHSSKGLEFPVVFLAGMENGIFPGESSMNNFEEMEEARRLCYVAITRAEEQLYMTCARTRMNFGRYVSYPPSDFIDEISSDLKEEIRPGMGGQNRGMGSRQSTTQTFSANRVGGKPSYLSNTYSSPKPSASSAGAADPGQISVGCKVKHNKFGIGTVISATNTDTGKIVTIAFDSMGIKKINASVAPLTVL